MSKEKLFPITQEAFLAICEKLNVLPDFADPSLTGVQHILNTIDQLTCLQEQESIGEGLYISIDLDGVKWGLYQVLEGASIAMYHQNTHDCDCTHHEKREQSRKATLLMLEKIKSTLKEAIEGGKEKEPDKWDSPGCFRPVGAGFYWGYVHHCKRTFLVKYSHINEYWTDLDGELVLLDGVFTEKLTAPKYTEDCS